jgi:iron(II)-dependent oxidoreductase
MDLKELVADELEAVRRRSLELLAPLPEHDLQRQISPIMSPLVWDLAHVGNYEELWLLRAATGAPPIDPSLDSLYDAFRHPRKNRPSLPLLGPVEARRYIADVRDRVLDSLDRVAVADGVPLTEEAFVYGMVIQHEHQHDETMLATLQLMEDDAYRPVAPPPPPGAPLAAREVRIPAGTFVMGSEDPWAYDNERPSHDVDVAEFWIETTPVTNGQYREFIADGGYREPRWWGAEGWAWREAEQVEHPQFWRREGPESWSRVRFGWREDMPADEPVQHVSWHEADAYARWAGKRLPTEAEWEKAASAGAGCVPERNRGSAPERSAGCVPERSGGSRRRYPWGDHHATSRANLGQRHFRPAPVGAYPDGASPLGVHQLIGDVWEWTSSDFEPYPGFASFPYREYSEVFFGSGYKVLRGGSWATDPVAARTTFRNWDLPIRRQIFAGFRCARDA